MAKREARIAIEPLSHTTKSGQRYHRMPEVEAQIASVLHLPPNEIVARARISDSAHPEFLKEECLVYFVRTCHKAADSETVDALIHVLLRRCAPWISGRLRALGLNQEDAVVAYQEIVADMVDAVIDSKSDRGEFFQVRFRRALMYWLLNFYDKWARLNKRDQQHDRVTDSVGRVDRSDKGLDSSEQLGEYIGSGEDLAMDTERRLLIQDALFAIRDERHREAFVLHHYEDWPLEAKDPHEMCLSRRYGVNVRTVHNWLQTAEADLVAWRETRGAR